MRFIDQHLLGENLHLPQTGMPLLWLRYAAQILMDCIARGGRNTRVKKEDVSFEKD